MMTFDQITEIVCNCKYQHWDIEVKLDGNRPYLQIHVKEGLDNMTGLPLEWTGRKWFLSYHMVKNEIVRTAFKAITCAVQHETEELFTYRGVSIFNPHLDPDKLVDFASNHDNIQERDNAAFGV